jgi:hypothetical protein
MAFAGSGDIGLFVYRVLHQPIVTIFAPHHHWNRNGINALQVESIIIT